MSLFYDILEEIGKRSKPGNNTISKTLDYILENYSDPTLSNKDLAEKSNISEVYFRKLFKDCFGTTPKQYILDLRIKMACKMLLENRYSISEISEKCGFSSVYHFCRAFKSITELTPGEYSKSYNSLKKYI
jgi:AraC-like DNA-binding protein